MEGRHPIVTAREVRELNEMIRKMDNRTFVVLYNTAKFLTESEEE